MNRNDHEFDDESMSALLPAAQGGSEAARNELFKQLQSYLAWISHREFDTRLQNKLGESDIVQQSYVRAIERFDDFDGTDPHQLMAWLRQIMSNEMKQARRALTSEKRDWRRERATTALDSQGQTGAFEVADSLPTPGTQALANEQAAAIMVAMQRLSEDHRQVIELRNWQRISFAEIAEKMNRSENAVTKLWFRALVRLESELERQNELR